MRILITGITGFVGGHLVEALSAEGGHTLVGLGRGGKWPSNLAHLHGAAELHAVELCDRPRVEAVLQSFRPEWLIHLAGYANTGKSFQESDRCWADNLLATKALYDAVLGVGLKPRILFASTGLVYGEPDEPDQSCHERTTLKPASPYAASKAAADLLSYQYHRTAGLEILRVRLFNQIGPRQPADYAIANFARQIAAAEAHRQPPIIETGDLSGHRDLTDVRDMVRALRLLLEHGRPGEAYNAGRGQTWKIGDILQEMLALARLPITVHSHMTPGRKGDTIINRADVSKLRQATGWEPRWTMTESLTDILNAWRAETPTE